MPYDGIMRGGHTGFVAMPRDMVCAMKPPREDMESLEGAGAVRIQLLRALAFTEHDGAVGMTATMDGAQVIG